MLPEWVRRTPAIEFLAGLCTVRDNPYLPLLARRHARERRHAIWPAASVGVLALSAWGSLALLAGRPDAGIWASAVVATVEFHLIFAITRATLFVATRDLGVGASVDCQLVPVSPSRDGGMRRTYTLVVAGALVLLSLPVHAAVALAGGGEAWRWLWCQVVCIVAALLPGGASLESGATVADLRSLSMARERSDPRRGTGLFPLVLGLAAAAAVAGHGGAWSQAASHAALYPAVAAAALGSRPLWHWSMPAGLVLLGALPHAWSLRERVRGRLRDGRAETIRVWPWSFGLTATMPGLTLLLGFLWPAIQAGTPARVLGLAGPDVTRSAEGTLAATLACWCLVVGLFGRAGHALSYGVLRSPREHVEPPSRRRAWLHELGWMLEAGLSVYVPVTAFSIAWSIGGDVPWPPAGALWQLVRAAAVICAGSWGLTRVLWMLCERRWWGIAIAFPPTLLVVAALGLGFEAPASDLLLGMHPLPAAVGLAPGAASALYRLLCHRALTHPPDLGYALLWHLAYAGLGVAAGASAWSARRTRLAARPEPARTPVPLVERYARSSLMERLSGNPVAVRLTRGRNRQTLEVTRGACLALALTVDGTWLGLTAWAAFGTEAPWQVGEVVTHPAFMALLVSPFLFLGPLVCAFGPGVALAADRQVGSLGATCLTPMSDREILGGYVDRSRYAAQVMLPSAALIAPLCFVGSPLTPVVLSFGSALLLAVPFWALSARLSLLGALVRAPDLADTRGRAARFADGLRGTLAWSLVCTVPIGLVAQPIALCTSRDPWVSGLAVSCTAATLLCMPALLLADRWAHSALLDRFAELRLAGIPLTPFERPSRTRRGIATRTQ